jgi:hypothetical protein
MLHFKFKNNDSVSSKYFNILVQVLNASRSYKLNFILFTGEYILQKLTEETNEDDISNLLLQDALQFVIDSDLNVSGEFSEQFSKRL